MQEEDLKSRAVREEGEYNLKNTENNKNIMTIYKKTKDRIAFSANINESLANAIRRSVQEIPILAIDELEIFKNDSALYDEMIAHRIGLIPIKNDIKIKAKKKGKDESDYEIKLKITKKGPGVVFSGDLSGGAEASFKEMPITVLKKGQEVELVATARIGTGIEHVKHTPGLLHYREFWQGEEKKGKSNVDKEFLKEFPILMIDIGSDDKEAEFERHKLENGRTFGEAYKMHKGDLNIEKGEGLMFFVESFGQIEPEKIIIEAVEALKNNLNYFKNDN